MAVTVSGQYGGAEFVSNFAIKVLKAQSDRPPQIFINGTRDEFEAAKRAVEKATAGDARRRNQWLGALTHVGEPILNWQQDFMQSYADPRTGRPAPRELSHYRRLCNGAFETLSKSLQSVCGVKAGPSIDVDPSVMENGHSGGNIEGGPAGICVLGKDSLSGPAHARYAKESCGGGALLAAPTEFLDVGHADEMSATIRTGPGECDQVMLVASPEAALKALAKMPGERALDILKAPEGAQLIHVGALMSICRSYLETGSGAEPSHPSEGIREQGWLERLLNPSAHAGIKPVGSLEQDAEVIARCQNLTNGQFLKVYASQDVLPKLNEIVGRQMAEYRRLAEEKWKQLAPGCNPRVIEWPALYQGRLSAGGSQVVNASTLLPNVSNLQQFGKTLIIPDPENEAIRQDLRERAQRLGLKADFINTTASHLQKGNLHCTTNAIRYCRPRGSNP